MRACRCSNLYPAGSKNPSGHMPADDSRSQRLLEPKWISNCKGRLADLQSFRAAYRNRWLTKRYNQCVSDLGDLNFQQLCLAFICGGRNVTFQISTSIHSRHNRIRYRYNGTCATEWLRSAKR